MSAQPYPNRLTDRKRDAIVQAAIAEFRQHGFNGTSMDRVAAAATRSMLVPLKPCSRNSPMAACTMASRLRSVRRGVDWGAVMRKFYTG